MGPVQGMEGVFLQIGQLSHRFHPTVGPMAAIRYVPPTTLRASRRVTLSDLLV